MKSVEVYNKLDSEERTEPQDVTSKVGTPLSVVGNRHILKNKILSPRLMTPD